MARGTRRSPVDNRGVLYHIVQRLALDHLRRRPIHPLPEDLAAGDARQWQSQVAVRLDVETVLAALARSDRAALWLFYFDGWTTEAIARDLGVTRANVRGRLHRARRRFMKGWNARDGPEGGPREAAGVRGAREGGVPGAR